MRMLVPALALALMASLMFSLTACGGGDEDEDEGEGNSKVYKSMGMRQCSGGGVSLATLQAQLAAANVQASSAACGTDGSTTSAVCGAPDGKIGIFEISPDQAGAAAGAGFVPLSTLPAAKTIPCS